MKNAVLKSLLVTSLLVGAVGLFAAGTATVTLEKVPGDAAGTVMIDGTAVATGGTVVIATGAAKTIVATATGSYSFVRWQITSGGADALLTNESLSSTSLTVNTTSATTQTVSLRAIFSVGSVTITTSGTGTGTVKVGQAVDNITAATLGAGGTFTVPSNATSRLPAGTTFKVTGSPSNDGTYTVASVAYTAPNTVITVTGNVPAATAGGGISTDSQVTSGNVATIFTGSIQNLIATPAVGSRFLRWEVVSGDDLNTTIASYTTASTTINIAKDYTKAPTQSVAVTAVFAAAVENSVRLDIAAANIVSIGNITGVSQASKYYTLPLDYSTTIDVGDTINVAGSTGNNGSYTVNAISYIRNNLTVGAITGGSQADKTFTVATDMTKHLVAGTVITVNGTATVYSTANDNSYTVASSSYNSTTGATTVIVSESIPAPVSYSIVSASAAAKTFGIAGDLTTTFPAGSAFNVYGSTGNNGSYTVSSSTYTAPNTIITTVAAVPSSTADGVITKGNLYAAQTKITVAEAIPNATVDGAINRLAGMPAISGMPGTTYAIATIDATNKKFGVAGDYTAYFTAGIYFKITPTAANPNSGYYSVVSSTYTAPNTIITVNETIQAYIAVGDKIVPQTVYTEGGHILSTADFAGYQFASWAVTSGSATIGDANARETYVKFTGAQGAPCVITATYTAKTLSTLTVAHSPADKTDFPVIYADSSNAPWTGANLFHVSGDQTSKFTVGVPFKVSGSDCNDGVYITSSSNQLQVGSYAIAGNQRLLKGVFSHNWRDRWHEIVYSKQHCEGLQRDHVQQRIFHGRLRGLFQPDNYGHRQ